MPVVYLVDERITQPRSVLDSIPEVDLGFLISSYTSIPEIVSMVIKGLATGISETAPPRRGGRRETPAAAMITAFRIYAHGDAETIHLGRGIDERNAVQLKSLSAQITGGAGAACMLLGCNLAISTHRVERFLGGAATAQRFGSPCPEWSFGETRVRAWGGHRLLHALARTLGIPVTAALDTQTLSYDGHHLGATITVDSFGQTTFTGVDTPAVFEANRHEMTYSSDG